MASLTQMTAWHRSYRGKVKTDCTRTATASGYTASRSVYLSLLSVGDCPKQQEETAASSYIDLESEDLNQIL
jgi:hypothetical protein